MAEKQALKRIEKARRENATELSLSKLGLTSVPAELAQLTNLQELDLSNNQLTGVPTELALLTKLQELDLSNNQLTGVPTELAQLTNLQNLYLDNDQLTSVPAELAQLTKLQALWLSENQLTRIPPELAQLTNLEDLDLDNNQLTSVPTELAQLTKLQELDLSNNQLTGVPPELAQLTNLECLSLDNNQLTGVPPELAQLTNLEYLSLENNQLTGVPTELAQLTNLQNLYLDNNQLTGVPPELAQLTKLQTLILDHNQLTGVPPELAQLTNLQYLFLDNNQLKSVPAELAQLTNLKVLSLDGNLDLTSPPPEIVQQGIQAILAYLREEDKIERWVSKLIVVGEGGVGKTSLVRALRGDDFELGFETTHGIDVGELRFRHPQRSDVDMVLKTWDFGGQSIYHATHQFFMTERSLFVLVWDARHGWEAGKLHYWLDTIHARAPKAPVMIVAAHIDERHPDVGAEEFKKKYPQITGFYEVSNKDGRGIKELNLEVAKVAADQEKMPLMGALQPKRWVRAAEAVRNLKKQYIRPSELERIFKKNNVKEENRKIVRRWLHDLGEILYFEDDEDINDMVILDAEWVTEQVSKVLESTDVIKKDGIFTQAHMNTLWSDVADKSIREHLLRLMERFDLSYRTLDNREISLVVERLPLDPPKGYEKEWEVKAGDKEVSMKFELSSLQAGLPTWFIARAHRFTTHTHWRSGAVFADDRREKRHVALVEAFEYDRYLRLGVRGAMPANFFALLRDGLELTLRRYPGLDIKRKIPCPGHGGRPCRYEFDLRHVERACEMNRPTIECPEAFEEVEVAELLYGVVSRKETDFEKIMGRLDKLAEGQEKILAGVETVALLQREFTNRFDSVQKYDYSRCPNVFAVLPAGGGGWVARNITGEKMALQLYCQKPGRWHPTYQGGNYKVRRTGEFIKDMGPYIGKLAKVLGKSVSLIAPMAGVVGGVAGGAVGASAGVVVSEELKHHVKLMEELAKKLEGDKGIRAGELLDDIGGRGKVQEADGAALRALRKFLDEVDKQQHWGGLKFVPTPEGHYLWLCQECAREYEM